MKWLIILICCLTLNKYESTFERTYEKYDKFYCINASVLHICVLHGYAGDNYDVQNTGIASINGISGSCNSFSSDTINDLHV